MSKREAPPDRCRLALADQVISSFNVGDKANRDFLCSVIASDQGPPSDMEELISLSLMRGVEEWEMLFECARAMRNKALALENNPAQELSLLPFLRLILSGDSSQAPPKTGKDGKRNRKKKTGNKENVVKGVSRFWAEPKDDSPQIGPGAFPVKKQYASVQQSPPDSDTCHGSHATRGGSGMLGSVASELDSGLSPEQKMYARNDKLLTYEPAIEGRKRIEPAINPKRAVKSPFFSSTTHPTVTDPAVVPVTVTPSPSSAKKRARPPRGAVSGLPIPPLSASRFGLIQEELADDPFRVLVAVTFLIRTAGKVAIPVFYELMGRFPGPAALAAADPAGIISLIRPLGLSAVRCAAIQKYARAWLSRSPTRDKRYGVKNYPLPGDGRHVRTGEEFGPEGATGAAVGGCPSAGILLPPDEEVDAVADARQRALGCAWEIGYLTQGPYALDSWRIFCRDVLLGRATHWTGKGSADPTFQPEWMRVLPKDKELRACLRWMWFREGWEWDPLTDERQPLREELRKAIDGGHVGYDDHSSLIILDQQLEDLS